MIYFPNAKINIGLNIIEKRPDGFHNLETVFYPVSWCEPLEVIVAGKENNMGGATIKFESSGIPISGDSRSNLCVRAYNLLSADFALPPVDMHLHKVLPIGAGLGGGSADAAFTIKILNDLFQLHLSAEKMQGYARQLGSDCAFFIENKPVLAYERGDVFVPVGLNLSGYYIALVKPPVHISTAEAYAGIHPRKPERSLKELIQLPVEQWKDVVMNDFEASIFTKYPQIETIKKELYSLGAIYASMSGSGSCVYGLFSDKTNLKSAFQTCEVWEGKLKLNFTT